MKPSTTRLLKLLALGIVLVVPLPSPLSLRAQEARGTITGKLTDSSNAVIPGATVKITNVAMGTTFSVITNDAGLFQAPYLIPGTYRIVVDALGFKQYIREGITLRVNDILELNISLQVGAVGEQVTVTAETPVLETATASMGQVVDSRRVAELPTPHGDPFALMGLTSGASYTRDQRLDRPFEPTHIVGYSIDGTRANRSDITIDGVASASRANGNEVIASYVPPTDLVDEIKVQTATFDASFGNTEGGVTNISIKSGTNSLHGTVYYWDQPGEFAANDFFGNATSTPPPDTYNHRWGGTVGGPVYLPKLYNGRNKTFFMYGFEGIHEARPRNNGTPTVPTAAMKNGDFSALLALGTQYQIYNPFTRRAIGGGRYQADPFQGNIIPRTLINPIAKGILDKYFPDPLTPGRADGTGNFQQPDLKETAKYATNTIRVDHVISDKQRIFGRASWYDRNSDYNNYFHNLATGTLFQFVSRQATLDDVYTFNATTVLNVRYGYNRFIRADDTNPANHGFDLTSLGFPASYDALIPTNLRRFPAIDITGYQGTRVNSEVRPNDVHSFVATLHKIKGPHAIKTGLEYRDFRQTDRFTINDVTGRFNFDSTWTRGPFDNSQAAPGSLGQSVAAFLLGLPSPTNSYISRRADYAERSTTWGAFVQDEWKVNPKLTLTLGVRYELETPLTERHDKSVTGFDYNAVQPIEAQVRANYARNPTSEVPVSQFNVRGGLLFAGVGGQGDGLYETPKKNLMPRVGFAYKLGTKTVVRGGYGIFYGFLGQRRGDVIQSGFSRDTNFIVTSNNTLFTTWDNPLSLMPNGIQEPVGAAQGIETLLGQGISFFNPQPLSPYMQRWELGFQHELLGGFLVEASYVGNRGTHIEIGRNLNATPQKYLSTSPTFDAAMEATNNRLTAKVSNPFFGVLPGTSIGSSNTIAREQLLRSFPQFLSVNGTTNDGYSWYHSLQLRLEKRFSKGYTVNATYTFSKFMQATEYLNADDPRPNRVISDFDRPHRVAVSGIYELPFGKARQFLAQVHPLALKFISGWQVSGIYVHQSGSPLGWGNIIFTGMNLQDIVSNQRSVDRWFNPVGFVALRMPDGKTIVRNNGQPVWVGYDDPCKTTPSCAKPLAAPIGFNRDSDLQLRSNVRTFPQRFAFLRGDRTNNYDFAIIKNTGITESKKLQLRLDLLNAFNHPMFSNPNGDPTSPNFGKITASTQSNYSRRIQLGVKFLF